MSRTEALDKVKEMDLYSLLGIDENSTKEAVSKAYRKKALQFHPDKNPDNPKAAEMFHLLTQALEILTDIPAKAAYDRFWKARKAAEERNEKLDSKRRKLIEDLKARESGTTASQKSERETSLSQLEREIQRLRKEGSKWVEAEQERLQQDLRRQQSEATQASTRLAEPGYGIKIRWIVPSSDKTNAGITEDYLLALFSQYGTVNHVIISPKRSGSAIVEFRTHSAAERALKEEGGRMFDLSWVRKDDPSSRNDAGASSPDIPHSHSKTPAKQMTHDELEAMVLNNIRMATIQKRKQAGV
ncbi:dnaJ homolog subfamily C member 17-like [Paramacrobiotus metropolitanus]|uniref:dnaJ homolog subfamily C member 17-like n=1 Tax=Paramacrobiotus metropolitanus TaxID=2943436 RepID=UPI0024459323|nr:dnaJ homolog subfamily C member 17-like [Paramacrobiotus metropolitanus]